MDTRVVESRRIVLTEIDAQLTPLTADELIAALGDLTNAGRPVVVANHNLHSVYLNLAEPAFKEFYKRADIVLIDGFPVLLGARRAARRLSAELELTSDHRIGSLDWIRRLEAVAGVGRIALVGAAPESNAAAVAELTRTSPGLVIKGWDGMDWSDEKAATICRDLRVFDPDVVLVGLGMPLQEKFITSYWDDLPQSIIATVGGAIDQLAGKQIAAPRWLGRFGLEWIWRLMTQPKRLGYRYLVEPWKLLFLMVLHRRQRVTVKTVRHSRA